MEVTEKRFSEESLLEFVENYLGKLSVPADHARIIGDVLLSADLRGINSHGLHRLGSYYGKRISKGLMNADSPYKIVSETSSTALIDGGNGCGQVVGYNAMNLCIEKAKKSGLAAVTVNNSNHFGIAAYYSMMAMKQNMIGISMTNSQPLVAPSHGCTPVLGTNPISVAAPTEKNFPYVLDMSTSAVAFGKIQIYNKKKEPLPTGWAIDSEGVPTNDASKVKPGGIGALLPLGGLEITSGYKGYCMAMMVDILCSALSGGNHLNTVGGPGSPNPTGVSHFFMAINIEAFRPIFDFTSQLDEMIDILHNSPLAAGESRIYIAGEKEFEAEAYNKKHGVPLLQEIITDLVNDSQKVGVVFPDPIFD